MLTLAGRAAHLEAVRRLSRVSNWYQSSPYGAPEDHNQKDFEFARCPPLQLIAAPCHTRFVKALSILTPSDSLIT